MERIGERLIWYYVPLTGTPMPLGGLNVLTVFNTLVVMLFILGMCRLVVQRMAQVPGRGQMALELYTGVFDNLVSSSLEFPRLQENRNYFPLIGALFLFLLLSNFMGIFPTRLFEEPTADINCTLGLGIMAMTVAIYSACRRKGVLGYAQELLGPLWAQEGARGTALIMGKLSAVFFLPLNIVGEMAKVVSISFRLFGNIIGGAIIITVVSALLWNFSWMVVGLNGFFTFFVGTVQAFVFTMLTLTYVAVAIK